MKKAFFGVSTNSKTKNQMKDSKLNLLKLILKLEKKIDILISYIGRSILVLFLLF
jgi:hypothetical protein